MRMRATRWMGSCQMIPSGGDGSEETITCTIGAYSWPGTIGVRSSVVEGRYCLTSAQLPTCGRLRLFLHIFFLFFSFIGFPPSQWRKNYKVFFVQIITSVMIDKERASQPIHICASHWISEMWLFENRSIVNPNRTRYKFWYKKFQIWIN